METSAIKHCRPASIMRRYPTTTPGKASGSVSNARSVDLPRNLTRARKRPMIVEMNSVITVVAAATNRVESRLRKKHGSVR
jgi:hypothetical protein